MKASGSGKLSPMSVLTEKELEPILSKLRLSSVSTDFSGLAAFYRAWCLGIPFDDLQKTLSLFENPGSPLPPLDARQFFVDWLSCGTGGTCWQHSDAIYTLAHALGFDAHRAVASMHDTGQPGHGTVLVYLPDGSSWILDNAFLSMEPLRIDAEAPSRLDLPYFAEVEIDGDEVFVHGYHPPLFNIFFRLIDRDVPEEFYSERWSHTYKGGPFVRTAHVRRNYEDRFYVLRGNTLFKCQGESIDSETLEPDGIKHHLRETFLIAPHFVDRWAASGALESSMIPTQFPPELPQRTPPSRRTAE